MNLQNLKKMKTLPNEFKKRGFIYKLLKSTPHVAMYHVTTPSNFQCYEVMTIRYYTKDYDLKGIKAGDIKLPSSEEWGSHGWTYTNMSHADQKYNEINSKQQANEEV